MEEQIMKAFIVYGGSPEFWHASLILENGWAAFGHLCSHPYFMPGDLLLNSKKRQRVFAEMGIRVEIEGDPIAGSDDVPEWLLAKYKDETNWRPFADKYLETEERLKQAGVI